MTGPTIETDRFRLRPLSIDDLDLALEMFTDPDVARYVGGVQEVENIRREMPLWTQRTAGGGVGVWCIVDLESNEKMGTSVLTPLPVDADDTEWHLLDGGGTLPDRDIEVGYILKKAVWGRGIATEVCRSMIDFGFTNLPLDHIVACTDPENMASQRVLRKCGLCDTSPVRAYGEDDIPGFAITRVTWLSRCAD